MITNFYRCWWSISLSSGWGMLPVLSLWHRNVLKSTQIFFLLKVPILHTLSITPLPTSSIQHRLKQNINSSTLNLDLPWGSVDAPWIWNWNWDWHWTNSLWKQTKARQAKRGQCSTLSSFRALILHEKPAVSILYRTKNKKQTKKTPKNPTLFHCNAVLQWNVSQ